MIKYGMRIVVIGWEDGHKPKGEINPVKVVLMFLSILIAAVRVCACVYV